MIKLIPATGIFIRDKTKQVIAKQSIDQYCIEKLALNKTVMNEIIKELIHPIEESDEYNRYSECFWKENGFMYPNGTINWIVVEKDNESKFGKSSRLTNVFKNCKMRHIKASTHGILAVIAKQSIDQYCIEKLALDKSVMNVLIKELIHPIEESHDYNRYSECFWKENGFMNLDGTINWIAVQEDNESKFGKSVKLSNLIRNCKLQHLKGSTNGITAVKNQNCLMKKIIENKIIG
ncbi:hypothetical protein FQA39_LY15007 [Lamprigera yunnana]|nr:hypothetical protein FQA39_LY15007 [Lamprigera yunnana]